MDFPSSLLFLIIVSLLTSNVTPFLGLPILTCNSACLTCSGPNADQCTTCLAGLLPLLGSCLCPNGQYNTGGLLAPCAACSTSCLTCNGPASSNCLSCQTGYNLYQGTCYAPCTSTQYFDTTARACKPCNTLCLTCNGASVNQCLSCQTATLTSGVCVCPIGQYTIALGGCANCDTTCKTCSGPANTQCTSCYTGMVVQSGQCVCTTGTYMVTSPSVGCQSCDNTCLGCSGSSPTQCTSCRSGFVFSGGQCTCPSGTYYDSGSLSCVACYSQCASCIGTASNQCTACKNNLQQITANQCDCPTGTYLDTTLITCRSCDSSCYKCSGSSASQCTDCLSGFTLTSGQCVCSGGLCSCPSGYYGDIVSNTCQPCSLTCQECSGPSSTECTSCWSGWTQSGSTCTCGTPPCGCPVGYYDSGTGTCLPCQSPCKTCSGGTTNDCLTCVNDLTLVSSAPSSCGCSTGYYMDPSFFCFECDPTCQTCSGPSDSQCLTCPSGMIGPSPLCTCPSHQYFDTGLEACATCDGNCLDCNGPEIDQCTSCATGKSLASSTCWDDCSSSQYRDPIDYSCQPCDSTCLTCSGGTATECLTCLAPRTFQSGSCPDLSTNGCYFTCNSCLSDSSLECVTCYNNMVLVEVNTGYGYCSDKCPAGYYVRTVNSQLTCRQKIKLDNRLAYGPEAFMIELTYGQDITSFTQELINSITIAIEFRSDQPPITYKYDLSPYTKTSLMLTLSFYGNLLPKNVLMIKYTLPSINSPDNTTDIYVTRPIQTLTLIEFVLSDTTGTGGIASTLANISAIGQVANVVFSWTSSVFLRSVYALRSEIVDDMIGYFIFMNIDYTPNFVEFANQGLGAFELLMPNLFMPALNGVEQNPDDDDVPDTSTERILLENNDRISRYNRHLALKSHIRMLLSTDTEILFNMRLSYREFLENHGAATSLLLIALGIIIVVEVMKFVIDRTAKPGRLRRYTHVVSCAFRWNFLVGHYSSEYQGFIFFSMVQLVVQQKPTDPSEILTFIFGMLAFLFSSLSVVATFLIARRANIKLEALEHAPTNQKEQISTDLKRIGLFFESFREESYIQLLYPAFLFTRCFGFGVVLVFLCDYPYVQVMYLILSTVGIIAYLVYIKPLKTSAQNKLTIVYEVFFLLISVLTLALHVYNGIHIADINTRSWICFMMLTIGTSMIVLNLIGFAIELLEFRRLFFKKQAKAKVAPLVANATIATTNLNLNESQASPPKMTMNTRTHSTHSAVSIPNFASDAEDQPIRSSLRSDLKSLYSPTKKLTRHTSDEENSTLVEKRESTLADLLNRKKRSDAPSVILLTDENTKKRSSSKVAPEPESAGNSLLNKIKAKPVQHQQRAASPKRSEGNRRFEGVGFQRFDSSQMPSVVLNSNMSKPSESNIESQNFDNKTKPMVMSRNQVPTIMFDDLRKNAPSNNNFLTLADLERVDSGGSKRASGERKSGRLNNSFQNLKPVEKSQDDIRMHSMFMQENDGSNIDNRAPPKSADRNRLDIPGSQSILQDGSVVMPRKMINVKDYDVRINGKEKSFKL